MPNSQFRATTRLAAIAKFSRKKEAAALTSVEDDEGDESEDEEEKAAAEAERLRLEEERLRMERENPPALVDMRSTFDQCYKKYHKLLKVRWSHLIISLFFFSFRYCINNCFHSKLFCYICLINASDH